MCHKKNSSTSYLELLYFPAQHNIKYEHNKTPEVCFSSQDTNIWAAEFLGTWCINFM